MLPRVSTWTALTFVTTETSGGNASQRVADVALEPRAHLQHEDGLGRDLGVEDQQREAQRRVLVALARHDRERLGEDRTHRRPRRRLADGARDGDDRRAGLAQPLAGLRHEPRDRVVHADHLDAGGRVDVLLGHDARGAFLDGLRDEAVAVVELAADGDVGLAGLDRAGVGGERQRDRGCGMEGGGLWRQRRASGRCGWRRRGGGAPSRARSGGRRGRCCPARSAPTSRGTCSAR